jgi:hypothetical protein
MGTNAYYLNQFISTTLATVGGIDDSQTTGIILTSVTGVETTKPGIVCLSYSDPIDTSKAEWISYTSISVTNELQGVTRGAEGFSAKSHSNGVTIAFPISESHINNLNDALIIGGSATNLATGVIDDDTFATASATKLATSESIKAYVDSGWSNANQTWTREGDNSFSEPIDATLKYQKGDKIRYKQGGGWKYQYIIGVGAYSGGKTIMTTTGGSDYKFDSGTAITDNYYSKVENPTGFPSHFSYIPTFTNLTKGSATINAYFSLINKMVHYKGYIVLSADSSVSGTIKISVPIYFPSTDFYSWDCTLYNNSVWQKGTLLQTNSTDVTLYAIKTDGTYLTITDSTATIPSTWATGY